MQCHTFGLDHLDQAPSYLSGSQSRLGLVGGKSLMGQLEAESAGGGGMTRPWMLIDSPPAFLNSPASLRLSFLISCGQLDVAFTASY